MMDGSERDAGAIDKACLKRAIVIDRLSAVRRAEFTRRKQELKTQIKDGTTTAAAALEALRSLLAELQSHDREDYIADQIPREFLKPFDLGKAKNPFASKQVLHWGALEDPDGEIPQPPPWERGIVAMGRTGTAKTRTILALVRELHMSEGQEFRYVRVSDIAARVGVLAPRHGDELEEYVQELSTVPILILDDLQDIKFTNRTAQELKRIIDYRYASGGELLMFLTSQIPGDELVAKFAAENPDLRSVAEGIVRRLMDCCQTIDFDYMPETEH